MTAVLPSKKIKGSDTGAFLWWAAPGPDTGAAIQLVLRKGTGLLQVLCLNHPTESITDLVTPYSNLNHYNCMPYLNTYPNINQP